MRTAPGRIAVKQIVWPDRYFLQVVKQMFHNLRRIVHALEQNRLIGDRNSRFLKPIAGARGFQGNFHGMIKLRIEPQGPVTFEKPAEILGYAHGHNHRNAAAHAQDFHMR